jgi:uncharacterized membrane protein
LVARLNGIQKVGGSIPPGSTKKGTMNSAAFSLIMLSAVMHATWNFYTKKAAANKIATLWLGWLFAGCCSLPLAIYLTDFSSFSWHWVPYIILTAIIHALYLLMLGHSYSIGEMSLIYPLARGFGILVTVMIVLSTGMDSISPRGSFGIFLLAAGILLVAVKRIRDLEKRAAMKAALMVGLCVSAYSIVDKMSIEYIPPIFYISIMFTTTTFLLVPFMVKKLGAQTRVVWNKHKLYSAMIGVVSMFTYLLILFALQSSPTAYVVALREVSIVFGSILGMWILKEESNKRKLIGIIVILMGAVIIKTA